MCLAFLRPRPQREEVGGVGRGGKIGGRGKGEGRERMGKRRGGGGRRREEEEEREEENEEEEGPEAVYSFRSEYSP